MPSVKNKMKKSKYHLLVLTAVIAITSALLFRPTITHAFSIPVCQPPAVGSGNGAPSGCFDGSGKTFYPVADNPDKSPNPEPGRCYIVKEAGAFGLLYYNASCTQPPFNAAQVVECNDGQTEVGVAGENPDSICTGHNGAQPARSSDPAAQCAQSNAGSCNQIFTDIIDPAIRFLSAGVGIVVTGVIIVGGIQYATAEDDPQKVSAAKSRIINALIALLAYIFLFSILQYIIPGGIF